MTSPPPSRPSSSARIGSPTMASRCCSSPGRSPIRRRWGPAGGRWARPGPSPALDPGWLHEIDGQPAIAFLARYLDVTGPASYGNPLAVIEAGGDEWYLRAIRETDPASGSVFVAGTIPVGAVVQLTTADTEEILAGAASGPANGRPPDVPGRRTSRGRADLLLCRPALPARVEDRGRGRPRTVGPRPVDARSPACTASARSARSAGTASSRYFNETFMTLLLGT